VIVARASGFVATAVASAAVMVGRITGIVVVVVGSSVVVVV
jgi:hypothetical protein